MAQVFSDGQGKSKSFTGTSQITSNKIFTIEDRIETHLLDREQTFDFVLFKHVDSAFMNVREIDKFAIRRCLICYMLIGVFTTLDDGSKVIILFGFRSHLGFRELLIVVHGLAEVAF